MTSLFLSSLPPNSQIVKQSSHSAQIIPTSFPILPSHPFLLPNLISLALTVTLNSPLPSSALPSLSSPSTPFSQSKDLDVGLQNGKIRPCPSMNPGCVSTNPMTPSFTFPLTIPPNSSPDHLQKLQEAILKTQKNAKIEAIEETPEGSYLRAEVDGWFGRDVMEFLVKGDAVGYRCVAKNVTFIYPFTTALGNSKGQEERMQKIMNHLGWYAPSFEYMD